MGNNHNEQEGEKRQKKCPLSGEWCTDSVKDSCELGREMYKAIGGVPHKTQICVFNALSMILSEINQKTQLPQQVIQAPPGLFRP